MKHEPWCPALRPSVFVGDNPCNCGESSRSVFRAVCLLITAVCLIVSLSILIGIRSARADTPVCHPIAEVVKLAQDMGGTSRPLTTRELDFARGMYFAQPNTPNDFPQGEGGLRIEVEGKVMLSFTRGELACELISLGRDGLRNLDRIAHGPGAPS